MFFEKWSDKKQCLEAVIQNGLALQYVKNQNETICLEAIKENGNALKYVKEHNETICIISYIPGCQELPHGISDFLTKHVPNKLY